MFYTLKCEHRFSKIGVFISLQHRNDADLRYTYHAEGNAWLSARETTEEGNTHIRPFCIHFKF